MRRQTLSIVVSLCVAVIAPSAHAAKTSELWEIDTQIAKDGGPLGAMEVTKLCFGKEKNFKEPPEKDDPNCKTDVKTSDRRNTFKSVCKDSDGVITSSGVSEEVGPFHFKSDLTITQEMRGQPRMQQRQVGYVKKLGTACDPNEMFERFKGMSKGGGAPTTEGSAPSYGGSAPKQPAARSGSAPKVAVESEPEELKEPVARGSAERESHASPGSGSVVDGAVEAGKSIPKGILRF